MSTRDGVEPKMQPITITIDQAVKISGIGRSMLYELIGSGAVPTRKIGTKRLVIYAPFRAFLEQSY